MSALLVPDCFVVRWHCYSWHSMQVDTDGRKEASYWLISRTAAKQKPKLVFQTFSPDVFGSNLNRPRACSSLWQSSYFVYLLQSAVRIATLRIIRILVAHNWRVTCTVSSCSKNAGMPVLYDRHRGSGRALSTRPTVQYSIILYRILSKLSQNRKRLLHFATE